MGSVMKPKRAILLALLMVSVSLSGCFGESEVAKVEQQPTVWDFERPMLTWYHFPAATPLGIGSFRSRHERRSSCAADLP